MCFSSLEQKQHTCLLGIKYSWTKVYLEQNLTWNNVFLGTMSTWTKIALEHSYLEQRLFGLSLLGAIYQYQNYKEYVALVSKSCGGGGSKISLGGVISISS